jgi:predicted nucleic acid-binding Zn ribbon protein
MPATYFDFRCPHCLHIELNVAGVIGSVPLKMCEGCGTPMRRYFGQTSLPFINYGERPHHDDIERFRFQNL